MSAGLKQVDYRVVGWGWMLWDFDWGRSRAADHTVWRILQNEGGQAALTKR